MEKEHLSAIANILRKDSITATTASGSGHPTSCMSAAEIMSTLFFEEMAYDVTDQDNPDNDQFILSKGHAAPILYSCLLRSKCMQGDISTLRKHGSIFEGHPVPHPGNWITFATGSLGQGFSIAVGVALAAKLQGRSFRTYVLCGDSEIAEGSVYEAAELAAHYKLHNLCAVVDANRLGQRGETMLGHEVDGYKARFEAFGCTSMVVDGHNIQELMDAFAAARSENRPTVIIAKTFKGKGYSVTENKDGFHGKALSEEQKKEAFSEIGGGEMPAFTIKEPQKLSVRKVAHTKASFTAYAADDRVATRHAYGKALAHLAKADASVVAIDAEVSNSTFAQDVKEVAPKQFVEAYIAEQNMIGMATGLASRGFTVFASSFAAFLERAHDQIRMGALSAPPLIVCGSHAGVSIGEDGGSQMGLEDISMFRALPGGVVLYPSDAVSAEKLVHLSTTQKGVTYIRTTRASTPILYDAKEDFPLGGFKVLRESAEDKAVLVGSGITVHESLKAAEELQKKGILAAVVDLYCIKPFDGKAFSDFVSAHGGKMVVTEDHYPEGGIGEMLSSATHGAGNSLKSLAVIKAPHSGKPDELLDVHGISAAHILKTVQALLVKDKNLA